MGFLTDWLTDWLKGLLIEGIMGNLTGLFDTVNTRVGEIAVQVGTTPAAWNAGVFSLIRQLSETVILPIAGLVLTFVATYELIQLIIEKNNLHDLDYWIFFKWIFKTAAAILILSNTFNIVMSVVGFRPFPLTAAGCHKYRAVCVYLSHSAITYGEYNHPAPPGRVSRLGLPLKQFSLVPHSQCCVLPLSRG